MGHASIGRVPTTHRYVMADVPDDVLVERMPDPPQGWNTEQLSIARGVGDRWLAESKTAILLVPSVVACLEWNALVNPLHPDAGRLVISQAESVIWDKRLFQRNG